MSSHRTSSPTAAPRWDVAAVRRRLDPVAFALAAFTSTAAYAGEVKVGASSIEIDEAGKITAKGKAALVDTLDEEDG